MTVSAWWVVWAFLGGGFAGIVVMATMFFASAGNDVMELDISDAGSPKPRVIEEPV